MNVSPETLYVSLYIIGLPFLILVFIITYPTISSSGRRITELQHLVPNAPPEWTEYDLAATIIQRKWKKNLDDDDTNQQVAAIIIQTAYAQYNVKKRWLELVNRDYRLYRKVVSVIKIQRKFKKHMRHKQREALKLVHSLSTLQKKWLKRYRVMCRLKNLCRQIASRWMFNAIERGMDRAIQFRVEHSASERAMDLLLQQMQLVGNSFLHSEKSFSHLNAAANVGRKEHCAACVLQCAYLNYKTNLVQMKSESTPLGKLQHSSAVAMRSSGLSWSCDKLLQEIHKKFAEVKAKTQKDKVVKKVKLPPLLWKRNSPVLSNITEMPPIA